MNFADDGRIVMTLDAGGTSFRFSAVRDGVRVGETLTVPTITEDLDLCLAAIRRGFEHVRAHCAASPAAISFAFPGPADYANGIIGDLPNIPAFRGGVPLGPLLEHWFGLPVFINNDGDLFAFGEALGGLLPCINKALQAAGNPRRYKNLLGITLGTGCGCGLVRDDQIFRGDNGMAAEIWLKRSHRDTSVVIEEELSIRAIRRVYAEQLGIDVARAPTPKEIAGIARDALHQNTSAARHAFAAMGSALGEVLADLIPLGDASVAIGGGLAEAYDLFAPDALRVLRSDGRGSGIVPRVLQRIHDFEESTDVADFVRREVRLVSVAGQNEPVAYDPVARLGFGRSRLGTSAAIALGAYAFALQQLS